MSDLITRDEALKAIVDERTHTLLQAWINIKNTVPSVDAVEVVRCKECRHWIGETEHYEDREYKACWQLCGQYMNSEFWCKYGERSE